MSGSRIWGDTIAMLRFTTAGESHGPALVSVLEGMPAGLPLLADDVDTELARRQQGYGRGRRMQIERDTVEFLSGVRAGRDDRHRRSRCSIRNRDWKNWQDVMDPGAARGRPRGSAPSRRDARAARPRRPNGSPQVRSRRRARHSRARVGARDDGARRGRRDLQASARPSSRCRSAVISCTSAASTRRASDPMPDDINAAADASPLRTLDRDAEGADDRAHRRDQARGQHARRHLRGRRRRVARRTRARTYRGIASWTAGIGAAIMSIPAVKGVEIGIGLRGGARHRRRGA